MSARRRDDERGVVLVLVLLIMIAVVALTLSLARDTRVEIALAAERSDALKLRVMLDSAIQRALADLRLDAEAGEKLNAEWRDNEAEYAALEMADGKVWFLNPEPDPGDGHEVRYGFKDTASLLDINVASREQLLKLPGITEEAVDGIIDWRDDDDEVSEEGAESAYYVTLDPPYQAKNGPIESLDELLRIKGIDEQMLYGEDRNRNGILDPGEDDGDKSFPPDDADGELDRGLVDYLTVYSRDLNRTKDNKKRAEYGKTSGPQLRQRLQDAGMDPGVATQVMFVKNTRPNLNSLGELVLRVGSTDPKQVAILLDQVTISDQDVLPGRININTCAKEILAGLPGLEEEDVEVILEKRLEFDQDLSSPAWLLKSLSLIKFGQIADMITTRSDQFIVQAVALLNDRPRFKRVEVVVDRLFAPVRVLLYRDITALGFPIPEQRGEDLP